MSTAPRAPRTGVPEIPADRLTPMFRQWLAAKREHPDALLLFRMGDFYELFFDDARIAAPILEIALTARGRGTKTEAPMCGIPHHALGAYVAKLVDRGYRVAICEQVEDPRKAKGMVRREVVRVLSPGTFADPERLAPDRGLWLAAIAPPGEGDPNWGIALVDLSTGEMLLARREDGAGVADLLARHEVREVLVPEGGKETVTRHLPEISGARPVVTTTTPDRFHPGLAPSTVLDYLGVRSLDAFGCPPDHPGLAAAAAALRHLEDTQHARPRHLDRLRVEDEGEILLLDASTRRNLELVRNLRDATRRHTLLEVLDRTRTPVGARRLRSWILAPLRDAGAIHRRQEVVGALVDDPGLRDEIREVLGGIRDLERLLGRAALGTATPHDLAALRRSLEGLAPLGDALGRIATPLGRDLAGRLDRLEDLLGLLARALADEPGGAPGEGRVIREGYDADLDEARELARGGRRLVAAIEARERERTGIPSLKVRYNKVFGYFIEVTRANLSRVPEDYERRQTLASGERFVTPELKELEARILSAEERVGTRERELFDELLREVVRRGSRLRETADVIGDLDALASLAEVAATEGYVRPVVDEEDRLEIVDGRHPVVERLVGAGGFVPNDCRLDDGQRILVVTGPNMGGKSTYLRQVALLVLMAQVGSFVPAREARIGVVDRVFCRVGAADNLAGGESTFMVEMIETANILHGATERSLVVLDEIGRGTSTWDGMAIAWAVVEHLHDHPRVRPKTLFATHYHELTELATRLPRLANVHITVREHGHEVIFLHRVEPGASDRSYGIHVARLAGLPDPVVRRAREILENLVAEHAGARNLVRPAPGAPLQLDLFAAPRSDPAAEEILARLAGIDPDDTTPRRALEILAELVELARRRNEGG